jgi:hypothetical protein
MGFHLLSEFVTSLSGRSLISPQIWRLGDQWSIDYGEGE